MGESYDFPRAEVFWPGAEGPPGQRVFFLAGGDEGGLVYLRCEKQQVAALGEYLLALLDDLSPDVEPASGHGAVTPLPFAWDVGSIGVKYDEPEGRIVVVLEELAGEVDSTPPTVPATVATSSPARTTSRRPPASASRCPRRRRSGTSRSTWCRRAGPTAASAACRSTPTGTHARG